MPVALSPEIHEEIFQTIKRSFVDFALFDTLVERKLRDVIADADRVEIDVKTTRKLTERYYDVQSFQTEKQKLALSQIHLILRTCYVLILSHHDSVKELMWNDVTTLLHHYPQFADQDGVELHYLLRFRNFLRIALLIIPPRLNKQLLLKIAAHLEGSGQEYITGGGQKPCVSRRVQIYEREGNIRAEKRLERMRPPRQPGQKRKRPSSQPSAREVKLLRLASEEIRAITKAQERNSATIEDSNITLPIVESSDSDSLSLANSFAAGGEDKVGVEELQELLLYTDRPTVPSVASSLPLPTTSIALGPPSLPISLPMSMPMPAEGPPLNNFPPMLSREQSDVLDRLLPDGEFWRQSSDSTFHPLLLMREISWDIYNGSFSDDLATLLK
eukprot:gene3310-3631_t